MSGKANKKFLKDPVGFMSTHFMTPDPLTLGARVPFEASRNIALRAPDRTTTYKELNQRDSAVCRVNLAEKALNPGGATIACQTPSGRAVPFVQLEIAPAQRSKHSHAFEAYYLPYIPNETFGLTLGNDCNYFFTAAMNGCRLALNPQTNLITHSNRQVDANNDVNQSEMRQAIRSIHGRDRARVFKKSAYEPHRDVGQRQWAPRTQELIYMEYAVSVFGVRARGDWTFRYQRGFRYVDNDGNILWVVDKFVSNTRLT